jgi:NAD(P)-dependent dehydrogenase (short-subunit alcohol dehydrogenase family)
MAMAYTEVVWARAMTDTMKNKTLFITGGNDGIGLATALMFAREGANIALMGRRQDKNETAMGLVLETGARCIAISGDVSREADIAAAIANTVDTFGGLHYAFNNAGVFAPLTPTLAQHET